MVVRDDCKINQQACHEEVFYRQKSASVFESDSEFVAAVALLFSSGDLAEDFVAASDFEGSAAGMTFVTFPAGY